MPSTLLLGLIEARRRLRAVVSAGPQICLNNAIAGSRIDSLGSDSLADGPNLRRACCGLAPAEVGGNAACDASETTETYSGPAINALAVVGAGVVNTGQEQVAERSRSVWQGEIHDVIGSLERAPRSSLQSGLEGRLHDFWSFIAAALQGSRSEDNVCATFQLGGSIDNIGDVAFTRDQITAPFLREGDLNSCIWHLLIFVWLGAGGPHQGTYQWLLEKNIIQKYALTSKATVQRLYREVEEKAKRDGMSKVFHGDSRSVLWRLDARQQGEPVLVKWHEAVPKIRDALLRNVDPVQLEKVLRSVHFIGELTAKEVYVLLHYACPAVADTTKYCPIGNGARSGAELVLFGARPRQAAPNKRKQVSLPADGGALGLSPAFGSAHEEHLQTNLTGGEALAALKTITDSHDWALERVPGLKASCVEYQRSAPHKNDKLRNCRVAREQLLDMADVEVMLCFYQNYIKLKRRFGSGQIPELSTPRGWVRR